MQLAKNNLELFTDALSSENALVRSRAIRALAEIQDKSSIPLFKKGLEDSSVVVRLIAAGALGRMGDSSGLKFCISLLKREFTDKEMEKQFKKDFSGNLLLSWALSILLSKLYSALRRFFWNYRKNHIEYNFSLENFIGVWRIWPTITE